MLSGYSPQNVPTASTTSPGASTNGLARGEEAVADEFPLVVADDLPGTRRASASTTRSANGSGPSAEYATSISSVPHFSSAEGRHD